MKNKINFKREEIFKDANALRCDLSLVLFITQLLPFLFCVLQIKK